MLDYEMIYALEDRIKVAKDKGQARMSVKTADLDHLVRMVLDLDMVLIVEDAKRPDGKG